MTAKRWSEVLWLDASRLMYPSFKNGHLGNRSGYQVSAMKHLAFSFLKNNPQTLSLYRTVSWKHVMAARNKAAKRCIFSNLADLKHLFKEATLSLLKQDSWMTSFSPHQPIRLLPSHTPPQKISLRLTEVFNSNLYLSFLGCWPTERVCVTRVPTRTKAESHCTPHAPRLLC